MALGKHRAQKDIRIISTKMRTILLSDQTQEYLNVLPRRGGGWINIL